MIMIMMEPRTEQTQKRHTMNILFEKARHILLLHLVCRHLCIHNEIVQRTRDKESIFKWLIYVMCVCIYVYEHSFHILLSVKWQKRQTAFIVIAWNIFYKSIIRFICYRKARNPVCCFVPICSDRSRQSLVSSDFPLARKKRAENNNRNYNIMNKTELCLFHFVLIALSIPIESETKAIYFHWLTHQLLDISTMYVASQNVIVHSWHGMNGTNLLILMLVIQFNFFFFVNANGINKSPCTEILVQFSLAVCVLLLISYKICNKNCEWKPIQMAGI